VKGYLLKSNLVDIEVAGLLSNLVMSVHQGIDAALRVHYIPLSPALTSAHGAYRNLLRVLHGSVVKRRYTTMLLVWPRDAGTDPAQDSPVRGTKLSREVGSGRQVVGSWPCSNQHTQRCTIDKHGLKDEVYPLVGRLADALVGSTCEVSAMCRGWAKGSAVPSVRRSTYYLNGGAGGRANKPVPNRVFPPLGDGLAPLGAKLAGRTLALCQAHATRPTPPWTPAGCNALAGDHLGLRFNVRAHARARVTRCRPGEKRQLDLPTHKGLRRDHVATTPPAPIQATRMRRLTSGQNTIGIERPVPVPGVVSGKENPKTHTLDKS
jgi:hypothetical protein